MEKVQTIKKHSIEVTSRNNKTILNTQLLTVIIINIFLILRLTLNYETLQHVILMSSLGILQITIARIMWFKFKKSTEMRTFVSFSFLIFYFLCLYTADCGAVYTFCIPMILVSTLYRERIINVIYTSSYVIMYVAAIIYGHYTGKFGYIDVDTMIVQISSLALITIAAIILSKSNQDNTKASIKKIQRGYDDVYYMATHDILTGLFNRNYLMINKDNIINYGRLPIAVVVLNINGLKLINDFKGNSTGDEIVARVGKIIEELVPERYIPLRLDGDEFMIIMQGTIEDKAIELAENIRDVIGKETVSGIKISVEYGVGVVDSKDATLDSCMSLAKNSLYKKKLLNKDSVRSSLIESLKKSLSESDFETEEHAERTKEMSERLGKKIGLQDKEQSEISLLAILHDIGKLSIPREILTKPGKLNSDEWEIMKTHTTKGYEIAKSAPELSQIADYILHHHEKWDGTGYPDGLKGENIPLLSRMITIVDSHDVMTHDRPYHKAMSEKDAISELRRCSGTQFDPTLVEEFIEMLGEISEEDKDKSI